MALTNEQYDSLMRQYNHKQMRNHQIVELRTKELYSAIPSLSTLDEEVASVSIASITAILDGDFTPDLATLDSKRRLEDLRTKRLSLISSAGYPVDYLDPPYDCPDCKDTGFINGSRCHCFKQAAIDLVYTQSNIKDILTRENFSTFDLELYSDVASSSHNGRSPRDCASLAYNYALNFVQHFKAEGGNLLLLGNTGCGKTFLSNCIAKELLDQGFSVIYFTSYELFEIFEKQTFKKDTSVADIHNHIFDCDLLIIDDLGTEMHSSFTSSRLFQCLNERLLRGKSTIISTNLSSEGLQEAYSERTTSRVFSNYQPIVLIGDDLRMKKINK